MKHFILGQFVYVIIGCDVIGGTIEHVEKKVDSFNIEYVHYLINVTPLKMISLKCYSDMDIFGSKEDAIGHYNKMIDRIKDFGLNDYIKE